MLKRHWCMAYIRSGSCRRRARLYLFGSLIRLGSPFCSSISSPLQLCCLSRTAVSIPRTGSTPFRARQVVIIPSHPQSHIDVHVSSTYPSRRAYRHLISSRGRSSHHYHMDLVHLLSRRCMSNSAHTLPQSTPHVIPPLTKPIYPLTQNHQR